MYVCVLINAKDLVATKLTETDVPTVSVFYLLEVAEDSLVNSVGYRLLLRYQQKDSTADGRLQQHRLKWSCTTHKTTLLERERGIREGGGEEGGGGGGGEGGGGEEGGRGEEERGGKEEGEGKQRKVV